MIFCFNPPIKSSVLQKYGKSTATILGKHGGKYSSTPAIYEEGNYNLNEDFKLKVKELKDFHLKQIHHTVEPMYTLLNGKCQKLTFNHMLKGNLIKQFQLHIFTLTSQSSRNFFNGN